MQTTAIRSPAAAKPGKRHRVATASAQLEPARINLRTSQDAKALIERAAALMGTTVSAFLLHNAFEAARRLLDEHDTVVLSQRAFDEFVAACEHPAEPTAALRALLARR